MEHHFLTEWAHSSAPEVMLAVLSQHTTKMRLGFGVILLPVHHPLHVAAKTATLDIMSDGRVGLGVGRAGNPYQLEPFGVKLEDTRGIWEKAVSFHRPAVARAPNRTGHRHTASHSSSHRCPFAHSGGGVQAAAAGNRRGGPGRGRSGRGGGPALGELFHEVVIIYYHELIRAPKPSFGGFGIRQPPPQQPCPPAAGTRAARASRPTPDALTIVAKYTSGKSAGDAARWLE